MRISEEAFSRVTGNFYAAGLGAGSWDDAVLGMRDLLGGGADIFDIDLRNASIHNWIGPELGGFEEYVRDFHAINPRLEFSLKAPAGHVAWDYRFHSEQEMGRDDFYHWIRKRLGLGYFVGTRLFDDHAAGLSTFAAVEFPGSLGHVSKETVRRFKMLTGHATNAWKLSRTMP